ncbi:MAG: succinyl-diaminopimelate desuccinylase [Rickettsiales bacterium]|nr:MAG: succinyl-diaminopimelate desuccinylase [Rickettsiales bacterium]
MKKEILELLSKLVSYPSVTPKGEDVLEFIADFLKPLGFTCIIKTFDPDNEVANLYAYSTHEVDTPFNLCFAGHVDVVPPLNEDLWYNDPFQMVVENDIVYGRGVVDMKGAIACSLVAVRQFLLNKNRIKGNISFLLTTDEEMTGRYGTQEMLKYITDLGHKIDFCILGEPTSINNIGDITKIGRRGSINFDLKIIGTQGHVAYPEKALNPISIMISVLNELKNNQLDNGSEYFPPSNLEITSFDCFNEVSNIIPKTAQSKFNIRFNDRHTPELLNAIIVVIIQKCLLEKYGLEHPYSNYYSLQSVCSSLPFIQELSDNITHFVKIVEETTNANTKLSTNGGTSDARFIHKYAEIVEFGLNCNQAHKINENCTVGDLQTLYNVYYSSLIEFLDCS